MDAVEGLIEKLQSNSLMLIILKLGEFVITIRSVFLNLCETAAWEVLFS